MLDLPFREIWAVDFEFLADPGGRPIPLCLVARELRSGRLIRLWRHEFRDQPPYPTDAGVLFVAYFASAEIGCHLELGWPVPARILDLYVEFRAATNGIPPPFGERLPGAMRAYGLDGMAAEDKDSMIKLILRGGHDASEREAILDYCQSDVDGLAALLPHMLPGITRTRQSLGQALLRGRYMAAVAHMERAGVPIDTHTLDSLRGHWGAIKLELVTEVDRDFGVYEDGSFREARFVAYLARHGVPWPKLESGRLDLKDDTFREMARAYPAVAPLRELRHALGELRLADLAVGQDGRNRTLLSPFRARTGRNQPSNSRFIFGPAVWLRGLIQPDPGKVLVHLDWSAQEVAIAAALSGDAALIAAVQSGDPYISFARSARLAPADATKASHGAVRDACKACVLGTIFGMGEQSLAYRIGAPVVFARELLALHRQTYPTFWRWSDNVVDHAMLGGTLHTRFGWPLRAGPNVNHRSLRNFPMQANGAEMLRLACSLATEAGVEVVAPVHDAMMVEAPAGREAEAIRATRAAMSQASREVLGGLEIGVDARAVRWPHRYMDPRGRVMWERVGGVLRRVAERPVHHWLEAA